MKLYNKIFGNKGKLSQQDIEKYISGNANYKEQHDIEAKSLQNKLFADAIDGYTKNNEFDISKFKNRTSKKIFKNNNVNYLVAIAAMFTLVTILFFIPFNKKNDKLAEIPTVNSSVKEEVLKQKLVKTKTFENNDETITAVKELPEDENIEKYDKLINKEIIVKEKGKELIADNSKLQMNKKTEREPTNTLKPKNIEILVQDEIEEEESSTEIKQNDNNIQENLATISKAKKVDKYSGAMLAGIPNAEEVNQKKKTFEDNFPVIFLADNTIKVANYSGKREYKNEVELELEDARSTGTRYANNKVAEAEMQTKNEYRFEGEYYYNDFLEKALFRFKNKKYVEAIRIFDVILKQYNNDINAIFYKALSFYKLKKYKNAIKYFDIVLNDNINVFDQEAEWNKALCLLKINRSEGEILLKKIVDNAGLYSQKAIILLAE